MAGRGRFSRSPGSAQGRACTLALPRLAETRGAAASINGALCSPRSQMPAPSSPHAERALCVRDQAGEQNHVSLRGQGPVPPRAGCEAWGRQREAARASGQRGQESGPRAEGQTHVASSGLLWPRLRRAGTKSCLVMNRPSGSSGRELPAPSPGLAAEARQRVAPTRPRRRKVPLPRLPHGRLPRSATAASTQGG